MSTVHHLEYLNTVHTQYILVLLASASRRQQIVGSPEYLCSAGGKFCDHSTGFLVCVRNKISQFDEILSHIMNKNIITLTNEIFDPIDGLLYVV